METENIVPNQLDAEKKDEAATKKMAPARRQTRKRRRDNQVKKASAAMYVGYVEEGETVEMIMKKFAKLEELEKKKKEAAAKAKEKGEAEKTKAAQGMTDADYEELFKETSTFKLESAVLDQDTYAENVDEDGWDMSGIKAHADEDGEVTYFFGDGTDDDLWDELFGAKSKRKKGKGNGSRPRAGTSGVTQIAFVSDMNGRYVTGLRKVRYVDPEAIVYTKIPRAPLPLSWAKVIRPYAPEGRHTKTFWRPGKILCYEEQFIAEDPPNSTSITVESMFDFNLEEHANQRPDGFQGIVLSPPWKERFPTPHTFNPNGVMPEDLLKLKLGSRTLMKAGFVYIWCPKHLIHQVLKVMEKMDFFYVENAITVRQTVDNKIRGETCQLFKQAKETLLILRRGKKNKKNDKLEWSRVEIRHQRTSDVQFNHIRYDEEGTELEPHAYVHNMVETMLPHGRFNPLPREALPEPKGLTATEKRKAEIAKIAMDLVKPEEDTQSGRLVHLWAPKDRKRTGWLTVAALA